MVIQTTSGTYSPVEYPFGQTMLIHELTVGAWVYASKPGTRLLARVVLPRVIDEATKIVTDEIKRQKREYGPGCIAVSHGSHHTWGNVGY
mgnify:CR=1 FL=1